MATTINSYSVGLTLDAKGYVDGSKLAKGETSALVRDINRARTPSENYARNLDRLERALKSGAISQGVYNRLLENAKNKLDQAGSSAGKLSGILANPRGSITSFVAANPALMVTAAGFAAITAAAAATAVAIQAGIEKLREKQVEIDKVAKAASKLGMTFSELSSLTFAAGELGGISGSQVENAIKQLQVRMAKAVSGDKVVEQAFAKLGLDAGDLIQKGPLNAIQEIAKGMDKIGSQAERLKLSMDIFGKGGGDLVTTLTAGSDVLEEAVGFQQKWNALTDAQVLGVEAVNDAWGRVSLVADGFLAKLAAEFAPAFHMAADELLGIADSVDNVDRITRSIVNQTVFWAGYLQDALEVKLAIADTLYKISTGQLRNIDAALVARAMDKSTAFKNLEELERRRAELADAASRKAIERDEERKAELEKQPRDTMSDREVDAIVREHDKFLADMHKQQEKYIRDLTRSISDAERNLQRERDRRLQKMRDVSAGPGAGMEVGSAEAAKFAAQQANAAIGAALMSQPTPAEQEMIDILEKLLDEAEKNGFSRIR